MAASPDHADSAANNQQQETEKLSLSSSSLRSVPDVIRFVYKNFVYDEKTDKCSALCRRCNTIIRETKGTTSAFTRHLSAKIHPDLRKE